MKTKIWMAGLFLPMLLISSCNTSDVQTADQASLKTSLNTSVQTLASAVSEISNSTDFKLLSEMSTETSTSTSQKISESTLADSINLQLSAIAGVYDYSWSRVKRGQYNIMRFFDRTGDNTELVVRLPVEKAKNAKALFSYSAADSTLTNNFEAAVSEYLYTWSMANGKEYKINSNFSIDNTSIGSFSISTTRNKTNGYNFISQYNLATGYNVKCQENSGDTATSVYSIIKDDKVLYEEKMSAYKISTEKFKRERVYSLTIGDVQIVRNQGKNSLDSAKVYVAGVLQLNSKVEIIMNDENAVDQSITHKKRDIQITFDDGTSTTIRELSGNTIDSISTIFSSVRQAYFATDIIDRIAWNIYTQK